jgi:hypothetical protein
MGWVASFGRNGQTRNHTQTRPFSPIFPFTPPCAAMLTQPRLARFFIETVVPCVLLALCLYAKHQQRVAFGLQAIKVMLWIVRYAAKVLLG